MTHSDRIERHPTDASLSCRWNVSAPFDDPHLVSAAGRPRRRGWPSSAACTGWVADKVSINLAGGVHSPVKAQALVAGMVAGADSIVDMDLMRRGRIGLFGGMRAPFTLGTFLRSFTFGHVRQLDGVAAAFVTNLASYTPLLVRRRPDLLCGWGRHVRQTYGQHKQGRGLRLHQGERAESAARPDAVHARWRRP